MALGVRTEVRSVSQTLMRTSVRTPLRLRKSYHPQPIMAFHINDAVSIDLDAFVPNAAKMEWRKIATSEQYREGHEKFLELISKEQVVRWVLNFRDAKKIQVPDQNWTIQEWFPRAVQTSAQKIAIVLSSDIFAQIAVRNIINSVTTSGLQVAFFETEEDAKGWLIL